MNPMNSIDPARVRNVIYGQAIGDSLGLPCEWLSEGEVLTRYPERGPLNFEAVDRTVFGYREVWEAGQWSDDTDMALCILDSYLERGGISNDIGHRFQKWLAGGRGAGRLTKTVLNDPRYAEDPWATAASAWEELRAAHRGPYELIPPNGAVMRTSYVGVLRPWDLDWTAQAAVDVARLTHADPRCVASAVALSVAVAVLMRHGTAEEASFAALAHASRIHPEIDPWLRVQTLDALDLDEGLPRVPGGPPPRVGHTYKTVGAAFWALRESSKDFWMDHYTQKQAPAIFEDYLLRVIRCGGDTDTNGAVVGALLGACSFALPERWVNGLNPKAELDRRVEALLATYPR